MPTKSKSAHWLALSAQGLAVFLLVSNIVFWVHPASTEFMAYKYASLPTDTPITMTWPALFAGIGISTAYLGLLAYALFRIAGIFRLITRGNWFETHLSKQMRRFGIALLIFGLSTPLLHTVMTVIVTIANPPGQRMLTVGINSNDYVIVLIGVLMIMLGHVMKEAEVLAKENREIV